MTSFRVSLSSAADETAQERLARAMCQFNILRRLLRTTHPNTFAKPPGFHHTQAVLPLNWLPDTEVIEAFLQAGFTAEHARLNGEAAVLVAIKLREATVRKAIELVKKYQSPARRRAVRDTGNALVNASI
jgi:hypothetical protein